MLSLCLENVLEFGLDSTLTRFLVYENILWIKVLRSSGDHAPDLQQKDRLKYTRRPFYRLQNLFSVWADHIQRCIPADGKQMKNRSAHDLAVKSVESARRL